MAYIILVVGGDSGVGPGLVHQLIQEATVSKVIATVEDINKAKDLEGRVQNLEATNREKLLPIVLNVVDDQSIADAVTKVTGVVKANGLNFLVNNAEHPNFWMDHLSDPEGISKDDIMKQFQVNSVAPLMIAKKFYPLLKMAADKEGRSQIVNISSDDGSLQLAGEEIVLSTFGSLTPYSMCKAALNMLTRKLSAGWENDNIRATSLSRGYSFVGEMKGPQGRRQRDEPSLEEKSVKLAKLILSLGEEHNGKFFKYTGAVIKW